MAYTSQTIGASSPEQMTTLWNAVDELFSPLFLHFLEVFAVIVVAGVLFKISKILIRSAIDLVSRAL